MAKKKVCFANVEISVCWLELTFSSSPCRANFMQFFRCGGVPNEVEPSWLMFSHLCSFWGMLARWSWLLASEE